MKNPRLAIFIAVACCLGSCQDSRPDAEVVEGIAVARVRVADLEGPLDGAAGDIGIAE